MSLKPVIALFMFCLVSGGIIAAVYTITLEPIREQTSRREHEAIELLIPGFADFSYEYIDEDSVLTRISTVYDAGGSTLGYIFFASPGGYGGRIDMMVAFDISGEILGIRIINHTETPGLGSQITADWFTGQFMGRSGVLQWSRNPQTSQEVDVIAHSTISVNAVLRGVNDAVEYFERNLR